MQGAMETVLAWLKEVAPWLLVSSVVIEIVPVKINPWTWIAKKIGKAINGDVMNRLDKLEANDKRQDAEREKDRALSARRRIILFADEIRRGVRHSLEHFTNIFEDINFYEGYCKKHEEFENERAVVSMETIKRTYKNCQVDNDFL